MSWNCNKAPRITRISAMPWHGIWFVAQHPMYICMKHKSKETKESSRTYRAGQRKRAKEYQPLNEMKCNLKIVDIGDDIKFTQAANLFIISCVCVSAVTAWLVASHRKMPQQLILCRRRRFTMAKRMRMHVSTTWWIDIYCCIEWKKDGNGSKN